MFATDAMLLSFLDFEEMHCGSTVSHFGLESEQRQLFTEAPALLYGNHALAYIDLEKFQKLRCLYDRSQN